LSSVTAIFGNSEDKSQDSDKLLNLYWNRAELKKEFAGMRKQQFRLQDRIKQQEGATARLQQKIDHLEDLLVDPQWVHNVVVFYQLRSLALRCEQKLGKFAEQLKQQREQRQHNGLLMQWNEARSADVRAHELQVLLQREKVQKLEEQLQDERQRLMSMSGFLKIFRRRSVTEMLDNLAEQIDLAAEEERNLVLKLERIRSQKPPDSAGLDIPTKRSINLMILAFAQQLYIHFADDNLAEAVRESREKSVGAINYGDRDKCGAVLSRIEKRVELLENSADFAGTLQRRSKLLAENAMFNDDNNTVAIAASVSTVYRFDRNDIVQESDANILGENYWAIANVLAR